MAIKLFELVGSVMVDNAAANKSLSESDKKASGLGKSLKSGMKTAAKWGAALSGAAIAAGAAIMKAAKDEAANLDVIDKGSIRMGISAEAYQELAHAAGLCGVEMTTMEKAAKKLEGTDMNLDQALNELMAIEDESARTAAAIDLFGESVAYQMTPLLQSGADGLAQMRQEANDLGIVMSQDTVSAGAAMNDQFSRVQEGLASLKTGIAAEFMPVVMNVLDWVIKHMPEIRAAVSQTVQTISGLIEKLQPVIEKVFQIADKLWTTTLKPTLDAIITFLSDIFEGNWSTIWKNIGSIFGAAFNGLKEMFRSPINWIIGKLNSFISGLNRIQIPEWVPGVGGRGLHFSQLSYLARGGVLEKGQTGFLEGSGAEAVVPLENNKKWISALADDMQGAGIGGNKEVIELLEGIRDGLTALAKTGIYLDGKAMVGQLAGPLDTALGGRTAQKARGLA